MKLVSNGTSRDTIKSLVTLTLGLSVATVAKEVINNNLTPPTTKWGKLKLVTGTAVLVSLITDAADNHVESKMDKLFATVDSIRAKVKEAQDGAGESSGEQPQE